MSVCVEGGLKRGLLRNSHLLSACVLLLPTDPAAASVSSGGFISHVIVEAGKVFFSVSGSRNAVPACATISGRWVFDASTPAGQAMMSGLLTFEARGIQVSVVGTGGCADWGDTESVFYIEELP
jgi:hypothetical protein